MVGIYKITSPSGKIYIGQSWNIYKRLDRYIKNISACKGQVKLYNSFMKHGGLAHKFEIAHELPHDVEQNILNEYEILYWQLHKDCGIEMLNVRKPGKGGKHTQETKDKISERTKGRNISEKTIRNSKEVNCIKLIDVKTLKIWESLAEYAKYINMDCSLLSAKLKHPHRNNTDCILLSDYENDWKNIRPTYLPKKSGKEKIVKIKKERKPRTQEHIDNIIKTKLEKKSLYKPVIQYGLDGNFIKEWDSPVVAGRELGIDKNSICLCARGTNNHASRFLWRYKLDPDFIQYKIEVTDYIKNLDKYYINKERLKNGINYTNKKVKVTNVITNEVNEFESIKKCSDFCNVRSFYICKLLQSEKLYKNYLKFQYK